MHAGVQVGESDITVTEGTLRQISVYRQQIIASPLSLTVFVTTIEGYRQRQPSSSDCNTDLSILLRGDESQVDPAED